MSAWDSVIEIYEDMIVQAEIHSQDDKKTVASKQDDIAYAEMILSLIALIRSQQELKDVKPWLTYYLFSIHLRGVDRRLFINKPEPNMYLIWEGMKSDIVEVADSRRQVHEDELLATIKERVQKWRDLGPYYED